MSLRTAEQMGYVTDGDWYVFADCRTSPTCHGSVGMSLRTTAHVGHATGSDGIAENESESVGMSLRTADQVGHVTDGVGKSLRTAEQVQLATESFGMSLRTAAQVGHATGSDGLKILWTNFSLIKD